MKSVAVLLALIAIVSAKTFYSEDFSNGLPSGWVKGTSKGDEAGDLVATDGGVKTSQDAKFYHYAASFDEFSNKDDTLVFQFSVKHGQGIDCGGGYLKLLPKQSTSDLAAFNGDSEYNIMFGPDHCGSTKRVHAIINYKGENHLIEKDISADNDKFTHVYTLVINKDQTFQVLVDNDVKREGKIDEEWSVLAPKKIPDPAKPKPDDWVDEEYIDDPEDKKPEGYDDIPAEIADPDATQPDDWDEDLDGEWTAPQISNPDYKGPWAPKKIKNPAYKGEYEQPEIDNPDYKYDDSIYAFESIAGVGLDVWQVKSGSTFGNILVTNDVDAAKSAADKILETQAEEKAEAEKKAEEERKKAEEEAAAAAAEEDDEADEKDDL